MKYLAQTITNDGKNEFEIRIRIAVSKNRFQQMYRLLTSKKIYMRHRLLVCYAFSVILYSYETWTLTKAIMDTIEACKMRFLRRIGKNKLETENEKWSSSKEIENRKKKLLNTIIAKKLKIVGHIRRLDSKFKNKNLEGKVEGRSPQSRPRASWCDNIK